MTAKLYSVKDVNLGDCRLQQFLDIWSFRIFHCWYLVDLIDLVEDGKKGCFYTVI